MSQNQQFILIKYKFLCKTRKLKKKHELQNLESKRQNMLYPVIKFFAYKTAYIDDNNLMEFKCEKLTQKSNEIYLKIVNLIFHEIEAEIQSKNLTRTNNNVSFRISSTKLYKSLLKKKKQYRRKILFLSIIRQ